MNKMIKFIRIDKQKKGVSLMISYVILIAITISISIAVFAFLRIISNIERAPGCEPGTSIIVNDYLCEEGSGVLRLDIKNNGRFSVDGFILEVGGNPDRAPITRLIPDADDAARFIGGYYFFGEVRSANLIPLPPEDPETTEKESEETVVFTNIELKADGTRGEVDFDYIRKIRIQPFVLGEDGKEKRVCSDAVIRQDFDERDCPIKPGVPGPVQPGPGPAPVPPSDPTAQGFHHWNFEGNLNDIKQAHFTEVRGSVSYLTDGQIGQAIELDVNDQLEAPKEELTDLSNDEITISFGLKDPSATQNRLLEKKAAGGKGFQVKTYPYKIEFRAGKAQWLICTKGADYFNDGNWHEVILTAKKNVGRKIYIDGVKCVSPELTGSDGPESVENDLNPNTNLVLGKRNLFAGKVDELKIWS